jgi:hypothetical protein
MPARVATVRRRIRTPVLVASVVLSCASVRAFGQTTVNAASPVGHGSAGAGVFVDLTGDANRVGSQDGTVIPLWMAYGWVFAAPRFSVGAEFVTLGTTETNNSSASTKVVTRTTDRSSAFYGVGRFRAISATRLNVDVVGGMGFQRTAVSLEEITPTPTEFPFDSELHLTYVVGADAPISVSRHFLVSPFARLYFLRGKGNRSEASTSSTAFAVGVTAGVAW